MLALVAGLAGAIVGWLLKTVAEVFAERRANRRADLIWRRERYVDATADLLHSARELMAADLRISRAIFALSNAEAGGSGAIVAACREEHLAAVAHQAPWTTATSKALEAVRLYAPASVVAQAERVWETLLNDRSFPAFDQMAPFESAVMSALDALRSEARSAAAVE